MRLKARNGTRWHDLQGGLMDTRRAQRGSHRGRRATLAIAIVLATLATALAAAGCGSQTSTASASASASAPPSAVAPSATPIDDDDESGASSAPGASFSPGPPGLPFASGVPGSTADRLPGEPDPVMTPGALNATVTQATIEATICVSGWTATIRPPSSYTSGLKIEQMAEYGYTDISSADYEEDHLISLELGGAPTDPRNLWPEPYTASLSDGRATGAHTKDGFETRLKDEVCAGSISLATAQSEIGDHWVHAFYGIAFTPDTPGTPIAGPSATPGVSASPSSSGGPSASSIAALPVRISSLTASVKHGANAMLIAVTSPGATCSASVTYASGAVSSAAGLAPERTAASTGKVSWTWKVGTSTKPGASNATVSCWLGDRSGSASKAFRVT